MRTINDDKSDFKTYGNTNGVYGHMQKEVGTLSRKSADARARFDRKPWYLCEQARKPMNMKENKEKSDGKEID